MDTGIKLCYCLLFIIFILSRIVEGGDNSLMNDDPRGVLYKIEDDLENKNFKNSNEYYNACTYNNGKDPNIRKNIEDIIKVLVKDSLPLAMENRDEQEHDIARDIQVAANEIIIELALHASKITTKIIQSMKRTNDTQPAIDTEMQQCTLIENKNQIKKMEQLEDKISLLSNNTEKLTDTINVNNKQQSDSIATINNKITVIENLTSTDSREIKDTLANIEKNQNPVLNLSETCRKGEEIATKITSFCDVKLPVSIVPDPNIWKDKQIPEKDDMDTYMIKKIGCSYRALGNGQHHELAPVPFSGQLEWRGAVRARENASMRLGWGSSKRYEFYVGYGGNTVSQFYDYVHNRVSERGTTGRLSEDRYVPFYIKVNNGKLTAGAECEPYPWFTAEADFTAEKGQQIQRSVSTGSSYGAKFLYNCPASFTGQ